MPSWSARREYLEIYTTTRCGVRNHDVGVRCLHVMPDAGVDTTTVITQADSPNQIIWSANVAQVTAKHGLRCVTPGNAHNPVIDRGGLCNRPRFSRVNHLYFNLRSALSA